MSDPRVKDYSIMETRADTFVFMEKRIDYAGGSVPIYIGYNKQPNADTSDDSWYIFKLTYSGSNLIYQQLPNRGPTFSYVWNDRANYFP
ncbi:MAG: hypothetical protein ACYC0F_19190 [Rhodanobacter sp.]